jgi:CHASE3 domain sensor protein
MKRHFCLVASCLLVVFAGLAQPFPKNTPSEQITENNLLRMERQLNEREALNTARLESMESRLAEYNRYLDRVLLIFGLSALFLFILMSNYQRAQNRLSSERTRQATREAEALIADIRRDMLRPEMEFLRTGHFLRQFMRRLRDKRATVSDETATQIRNFSADPHLPAALHYMANALAAEHDGQWQNALLFLEQLRQLESDDPDILLHLSHAHENIAPRITDVNERKRHRQLSAQYYGHFVAAMNIQEYGERLPQPPATDSIDTPTPQITAPSKNTVDKNVVRPTPTPLTAKLPAPKAAPIAQLPTPSAITAPTTPETPTTVYPLKAPSTTVSTTTSLSAKNWKKLLNSSVNDVTGVVKNGASSAWINAQNVVEKIRGGPPEGMPFLPVPPPSTAPENCAGPEAEMWEKIRQGDLRMAQAGNAIGLRKRNRFIDDALNCYTKAQGHKTNETLYLNWGLAFLAKALHVPEKKRDPFFNAAVDKFLAGNVISPHYFDFSLASLYAIIGLTSECRKWLEIARESNRLDVESLRHAPDFDNMRQQPWFNNFLKD